MTISGDTSFPVCQAGVEKVVQPVNLDDRKDAQLTIRAICFGNFQWAGVKDSIVFSAMIGKNYDVCLGRQTNYQFYARFSEFLYTGSWYNVYYTFNCFSGLDYSLRCLLIHYFLSKS